MLLWANAYAVHHRVPADAVSGGPTVNAGKLAISTFLPNAEDYASWPAVSWPLASWGVQHSTALQL